MKNNLEFHKIVDPILQDSKFQELKNYKHHGINRYDHSLRVAYHTYRVTSFFHLRVKEATEAALLHDCFFDEVSQLGGISRVRKHPKIASRNAKKILFLSPFQEDIIKTHMFPITFIPPQTFEGWIVDLVDDIASIYERMIPFFRTQVEES